MSTSSIEARLADPEAPFTPTTSDAMDAVFDTNELYHLIIDAVPCEHRTSLLRVSKAWKAATSKIGHVLKPIGYECRSTLGTSNPGLPLYQPITPFNFSRAIFNHTSTQYVSMGAPNTYTVLTTQPQWNVAQLAMMGHEFVTDPPTTQLELSDNRGHVASLRVPGGIRVGHLLEYLPKITQKSSHLYETWAVYACPGYLNSQADVDRFRPWRSQPKRTLGRRRRQ